MNQVSMLLHCHLSMTDNGCSHINSVDAKADSPLCEKLPDLSAKFMGTANFCYQPYLKPQTQRKVNLFFVGPPIYKCYVFFTLFCPFSRPTD